MRSLAILLGLAASVPCAAQQTPSESARVYELNEVEVLPRPQNVSEFTEALRQSYPPQLNEAGVGGTVQLAFVVDPEGVPGGVRVLSSPDSAFDAPSVQAISLLRFSPAQVQGRTVPVRVEQPIAWRAQPAADIMEQGVAAASRGPGDSVNGYELSAVEDLPRLVNRQTFGADLARLYPRALRDAGLQGMVVVRFRVEVDGTTSNAVITRSTNYAFDTPTLEAVRGMRFSPARLNGRPVRVWVEQPIQWSVDRVGEPSEANSLGRPGEGNRTRVVSPRVCGPSGEC
jgi:TonB family protein